jgi:hypothetical protein
MSDKLNNELENKKLAKTLFEFQNYLPPNNKFVEWPLHLLKTKPLREKQKKEKK